MQTDDLAHRMRGRWEGDPRRPALGFGEVWYDWGWIGEACAGLESALASAGLPPEAPVAVIARNRPGQAGAILALMAQGRCAVVISPMQAPERIAADIARLGCPAVLGSAEDLGATVVRRALAEAGAMGIALAEHGAPGFMPVAACAPGRAWEPMEADALVGMLTSGTTGVPKRLALRKGAVLSAMADLTAMLGECEDPGRMAPAILFQPIANISGMYFLLLLAAEGRPALLLERFTVDAWVDAVRRQRPSWLWLPPAAMQMVLDADVAPADLGSARALRTGSAPLGDALRTRFEDRFGIPVLSHYGATEFCGIVTTLAPADAGRGSAVRSSVGRARPGIRLRVVDASDGAALDAGMLGVLEVWAERLGPGWMRTTDLAVLDKDGFLTLHGRADDAINRGGFKILAGQVADALRSHPAIADAAVIGLPDARLGQVPVALLECRPGAQAPSPGDLEAFSRARLLAYQVPARFLIVPSLPRTGTMKIDRQAALRLFSGAA